MRITIYADSDDKNYFKNFYYLERNRKIDRLKYIDIKSAKLTIKRFRNFKKHSLRELFNSYLAPIKIFFSFDISVINLKNRNLFLPALFAKLNKKIVYYNCGEEVNFNNSLSNFFSKTVSITHNRKGLEEFRKNNYKAFNIPICVDTSIFKPEQKTSDSKIRIIYTGKLEEENGIKELSEVVSRFGAEKVNLFVVGNGSLLDEIKSWQKDSFVTYLGDIPNAEKLANIYTKSHIFVTNSNKLDLDHLDVSILGAMSCELPIVCKDLEEHKEIVDDEKEGIIFKDKEDLYEILKKLIDDEKLRVELGRAGREKVKQKFSLEASSEKLYHIFKIEVSKIPFR
ncbi:glycosyltransferase family 4 protein [Candidatus Woesearchaeota archaeon]|nr:glycosyltransferase family 4 protein [Candidatus Woesearchaeota archaeon]